MFRFKVDIFNEISWPKFIQLPEIKPLPLNEQVKKYNLYIDELTYERIVYAKWLEGHKKGPRVETTPTPPVEEEFLLQEDLFNILQEDTSRIKIS